MKDYTKCPNKRKAQSSVYDHLAKYMDCNVAILAGPAAGPNIENGLKIAKSERSRIYLIEKDPEVFHRLTKSFEDYMHTHPSLRRKSLYEDSTHTTKVVLSNVDIASFEGDKSHPARCEELDFCKTMMDVSGIFFHRLTRQIRTFSRGTFSRFYKAIILTVSMRGCSEEETKKKIVELVLLAFEGNGGVKRLVADVDPGPAIKYFKHYDTSAMITAVILYK